MMVTGTSGYSANYSQMQIMNSGNQDTSLKAIQDQIENVQKQLQVLSGNEKISAEEKMSKQRDLQQQLQDLNKQLAQRKIEIQQERREKAAAKVNSMDEVSQNAENQESGMMETVSMKGVIHADTSMKQVKTVQTVKTGMEGRAGVLEREIKTDRGRGSTEKKEAELAKLNGRINDASSDMMKRAADAETTLEVSGENKERTEEGDTRDRLEDTAGDSMYIHLSEEEIKGQYVDMRL
ncbi:FlxA-like family protein [Lacrimispora indolis]|uniref:FlxA-like family protein n=1 Tax=Lacrimispora indolis TaxID=69825 RepID=UPI0003FE8BAD|nr:FlxA-like family protein [[Clostridium] methoxybenzovorans]